MALHKKSSHVAITLILLLLTGPLFAASARSDADAALDQIDRLIRLRNYDQAVSDLQPLARQGGREASYRLASLYRSGKGVERNLVKATELYHQAAAAGHADAQYSLALLIEKSNDSPSSRSEARQWFQRAAIQGHARAAEKLENFETIPQVAGRKLDRDDVFNAIRHNDEILINSLIAGGASLDLSDRQGNSSLMAALRAGWPRLALTLIDNTRQHSQPNALGSRPLHVAANRGYEDVVVALLARKVDIDAIDARGDSALILAVRSKNIELANLLLERGADYRLVNQKGKSAVDLAYADNNPAARAMFDRRDIRPVAVAVKPAASDLASFRQSVKKQGARYAGWPLLNIAIEVGDDSITQQLLAQKPNLAETGPEGNTALHVAARNGDRDNLKRLLEAGAPVNAVNDRQETALYLSVEADSLRSVSLLLKSGADPSIETRLGASPLETAVARDRSRIARVLLGAKNSYAGIHRVLLQAIQNGMQDLSYELIKRDGDLGSLDENERSALWHSADRGLKRTSENLIASGAIDLNRLDINGHGALAQAIMNGHEDIVRLLVKWGADLHVRTREGNTLLMLAVLAKHPGIVALLLKRRVDVNAQDEVGDTALMMAANGGQIDIIDMLIQAGADMQLRNGEELNAYQIARNAGHPQAAEIIHDKSNLVFKLFN